MRLRRRCGAWAQRRQGDDRLPATLTSRRVYILPTRGGLAFAGLVLVMLLAGLNYSNSMAMLITFLLAGFALIAMHLRHRNLVGTVVRSIDTVDAFAGEHARLLLTLENTADSARIGLECATDESERVLIDVPPDATARADVAVPLAARGRFPIDRVKLSTAFPVRPVSRLDLDTRAAGRARLARAARTPRGTAAGHERRQCAVRGARR